MHTDLGRFRGELLALLLAGTFLLCHGGLWASHACADSQVSSASFQASGHHLLAENTGGVDHEQPWYYLRAAADHFAALLTVFLGLILGLLLGVTRSWGTGVRPPLFEHRLRTYALRPPRGPELALIQVFRL